MFKLRCTLNRRNTLSDLKNVATLWGEDPDDFDGMTDGFGRPEAAPRAGETRPPGGIDSSWSGIERGQRLRVRFPDGRQLTGTVDALTADLEAVWVLTDGDGRRMLHPADGLLA